MRATIAILLLIAVAQCSAHPVGQERAIRPIRPIIFLPPVVPRVTENPTVGAKTTEIPAMILPNNEELVLRDILKWIQKVSV
ncbi:Hypothetical predicted protein [Cloeon dipterum]|uniref:Uncharacterized protein n=1 Tax=Cloeon dipterum TaxID=197152 RepID=A0A8S1E1D2_9INSE|nr:Hypothetical predicted protein [Cloeon dipterum]